MQRIPLFALATLFLCGCASSQTILSTSTVARASGSPREPMPVTPRVLEQLPKGRYYRIRT
ncbi:MAG TPA: hypothetical protein VL475_06655, partial [Planctomycetaceae bacterium]|nr:hypothetical protein [Planctomycetaceae bacterium]